MEDYRTAAKLIKCGSFMATIDLKDAYFLILIKRSHQKYLKFCHSGIVYKFNCLPFGLSSAPHCYSKTMKPVLKHLRKKGIQCTSYLDDFLILGDTHQERSESVSYTIGLLKSLGFIINEEKSSLTPETDKKFLGFIFNSESLKLELPAEKRTLIRKAVSDLRVLRRCSIRHFASLIGLLSSACPALKYGWGHIKDLEREKNLDLNKANGNYNAKMRLRHDKMAPDLE
nr:unnamed protein product [Callosobruchus analis]